LCQLGELRVAEGVESAVGWGERGDGGLAVEGVDQVGGLDAVGVGTSVPTAAWEAAVSFVDPISWPQPGPTTMHMRWPAHSTSTFITSSGSPTGRCNIFGDGDVIINAGSVNGPRGNQVLDRLLGHQGCGARLDPRDGVGTGHPHRIGSTAWAQGPVWTTHLVEFPPEKVEKFGLQVFQGRPFRWPGTVLCSSPRTGCPATTGAE
jgi:hypothetical protein